MQLRTLRELDKSEGTVQMHKTSHVDADSDLVILVPWPNEHDPNDPLRWPTWKKHVAFASVCAFAFLTNYGIGGLAPAFYHLSIEFDKTMAETSDLLIWPILVLGVSPGQSGGTGALADSRRPPTSSGCPWRITLASGPFSSSRACC